MPNASKILRDLYEARVVLSVSSGVRGQRPRALQALGSACVCGYWVLGLFIVRCTAGREMTRGRRVTFNSTFNSSSTPPAGQQLPASGNWARHGQAKSHHTRLQRVVCGVQLSFVRAVRCRNHSTVSWTASTRSYWPAHAAQAALTRCAPRRTRAARPPRGAAASERAYTCGVRTRTALWTQGEVNTQARAKY